MATAERSSGVDHPLVPSVLGAAATAAWPRGDLAGGGHLAAAGIDAAGRLGDPPDWPGPSVRSARWSCSSGTIAAAHRHFSEVRRQAEATDSAPRGGLHHGRPGDGTVLRR